MVVVLTKVLPPSFGMVHCAHGCACVCDCFLFRSDRLKAENNRLAKNIDDMADTVQGLKDVEDALEVITKKQGQTVEVFAEQVEVNRGLLKKMQGNLKANVLQNLLTLVFGADANQDHIVNESEYVDLERRIDAMVGVSVKKDKFRAAVVDKEVHAVISIIENLLKDDVPEDERIFIIQSA